MTHDAMGKFYSCMNLPLRERIFELEKIIDHTSPYKELQLFFPQLISGIFGGPNIGDGWELKSVISDRDPLDFELLHKFLEPHGPMYRLCYKLLSDPQLKYDLPIHLLPVDLQHILESGRRPQFYSDLLNIDGQCMRLFALSLNPFDYYIFHFCLCLLNNSTGQLSWENRNSVYFALACDYLMHFLPTDPNIAVLPSIPHYTGKVPVIAPLQTSNRPMAPSLLLVPDLTGMNNQHANPSQSQSRNEVWRTETVIQVFIDIWMSVEESFTSGIMNNSRNAISSLSAERVRIVRVLVKHIHAFASKHQSDPAQRSAALRKYAGQIMSAKAYRYVKYLVETWPLDASFRLVLELWLSLIQPWRYTGNVNYMGQESNSRNNNQEENNKAVDASYTQFIAENFPSYTCILQMIIPRFMRLDLIAPKNAVLLFRLGKVFSQQNLVPILIEIEQSITENPSGSYQVTDLSFNSSFDNQSYNDNLPPCKWGAIAKQAITEMNASNNFYYQPVWCNNNRQLTLELIKKVVAAKNVAEKTVEEFYKKINSQKQGFWSYFNILSVMGIRDEDEIIFEEYQKVPVYLNAAIVYFSTIFGFSEDMITPFEEMPDVSMENSSFMNTNSFPQKITDKLRHKSATIKYMGDPDLMPITSYESTILVRILYQISTRINEMYQEHFRDLWTRNDIWGYVTREILQKPCTIQTYTKDALSHRGITSHELPARLSLRRLASHAFVVWMTLGYLVFKVFGYSGMFYIFIVLLLWIIVILIKAILKKFKLMKDD